MRAGITTEAHACGDTSAGTRQRDDIGPPITTDGRRLELTDSTDSTDSTTTVASPSAGPDPMMIRYRCCRTVITTPAPRKESSS